MHGLFEYKSGKEPPSESTVGRAMALNRKFHGAPGSWSSRKDDQEASETQTEPKYLPYRPDYRHHLWYIDIRYLVQLDGHWVYSVCILEGHSRTILAGMATDHQDLTVVLQILFALTTEAPCIGALFSLHRLLYLCLPVGQESRLETQNDRVLNSRRCTARSRWRPTRNRFCTRPW